MEQQWIMGLIGGAMVGLGGMIFLLVNGRVLGASGILGGLVDGSGRDNRAERLSFIAGAIGVPAIIALFSLEAPQTHATDSIALLVTGGLLTGIGTRLANGCTSGHAISGLTRFSPRALVATLTYTAGALVTVAVFRHLLGIV